MRKILFKCPNCKTIMIFEIVDDSINIHEVPSCICGKSKMVNMSSYEYAYGKI